MRGLLAIFAVAVCALAGCATGPGQPGRSVQPHQQSLSSAPVPSAPTSSVQRTTATHRPSPVTSHPRTSSLARATPTGSAPPVGTGPLVVLDPGHNGGSAAHLAEINRLVPAGFGRSKPCNTTGTNTDDGYPEHAFNFDVALRTRAVLRAHGVRVIMARSNDHGVGPCVNVRAAIESTPGVRAAVVIHADGAPSSGHGFHVNEDSRLPEGATRRTFALSHDLTVAEHDALERGSGLSISTYFGDNGYVRRDDFAGLNLSTVPTTFLELGNMRNAGDAALQSSPSGRQRIAEAVAAGILAYLGAH